MPGCWSTLPRAVSETAGERIGPRPIADVVGSERFDDPFRHLEGADAAVELWEAQQDSEARAFLAELPDLPALERLVARHLRACGDSAPVQAGGAWLRIAPSSRGAGTALWLGHDPAAKGRVLVDARDLLVGENPAVDWFAPSPDGLCAAVGVSCRGDERSDLHFIDLSSGTAIGPRALHVAANAVAWSPDSAGVYCLTGSAAEPHDRKELVYVGPRTEARGVLAPTRHLSARSWLQLSGDGLYLGVGDTPSAPRLLHVLDVARGAWLDVVDVADSETFAGLFLDGHYYAVTSVSAPRGRLVRVPVSALSDISAWEEVVPQREAVLRAIARVGDTLVLCSFLDGISKLELVSLQGRSLGAVPLPAGLVATDPANPGQYGSVPPVHADDDGLTFTFSALDRSPVLLMYDTEAGTVRPLSRPAIVLDDIRSERLTARADDGARVSYDLVSTASTAHGAARPTLLMAYGGWNAMSSAKGYLGALASFVHSGGCVAFAHVRGDATFGAEQWRAGRRDAKQRSFDDVYAVADDLVARGVTTSDRLALYGASNGGLLVGAAITQRPALFKAVVAVVPLFDMCRFVRDRFGEHCTWEYGDPRTPEAAAWLRRYSPYHNVRDGESYPATLIVCGACDVRTPAWHGRKMHAALRRATDSEAPVLLRVHDSHGHSSTSGSSPAIITEWLAFVMSMVGLRVQADG